MLHLSLDKSIFEPGLSRMYFEARYVKISSASYLSLGV